MASSDEEGEIVPVDVSDYDFIAGEDEPISFAELPVCWNKGEIPDERQKQIFLRGNTDGGCLRIYKEVKAWKFDLSNDEPEILVLSKEDNWIKLLKPRKAFQDTIRTILITVQSLHYVKRNLATFRDTLWNHLSVTFSFLKPRPSENDLLNHISLMNDAILRDEILTKSQGLVTHLLEKPRKRKASSEDFTHLVEKPKKNKASNEIDIGTYDNEVMIEDNQSSEEDDLNGSVCEICDDGGTLLCCQGKCLRSFHPTIKDGTRSQCMSLGYTSKEYKEIMSRDFYCENCKHKQHQCYICGELGSSDESSGVAEVFCCANGACGYFYHPDCLAKLLYPGDGSEAEILNKKIASGEPFACPLHYCYVCKDLEDGSEHDLQFAICRRCPKAFHRKCLPGDITSKKAGTVERVWENLIPKRLLIYCLDHKIVNSIKTPVRDHVKFPGLGQNRKKQSYESSRRKKQALKEGVAPLGNNIAKKTATKSSKRIEDLSFGVTQGNVFQKKVGELSEQGSSKKHRIIDVHETHISDRFLAESENPAASEPRISSREELHAMICGNDSQPVKSSRGNKIDGCMLNQTLMVNLDDTRKMRILAMTKDVSSLVTLEMILEKHKAPSKLPQSSDLTLGKVKCSAEAIRSALQKLEGGSSVQDAKAVCGTDLLIKFTKWKNKLNVYLAPFLRGPRYTSFGRHFTKDDKLKEIVNMLHWYVEDGDTIVDFCCGSNDFSCIMKKKLDDVGKNCSYKNYDIFQAKNDFSFERRDWMGVRPEELPSGSQLIMGLNPPFGVNADKLINQALEFKPKLLILIVPRKTQRLDEKVFPYDLIWENDQLLMGKSFYLPGSIDINGKRMEDWNVKPPPLRLWSHPEWTGKHKVIAQKHGHSSGIQEKIRPEETPGHEVGLPLDCSETNSKKQQCGSGKDHSITNSKVARERKLERPPKSIAHRSSTSAVNVKHAPHVDGRTQKVQVTQAPDCGNERTYSLSNTTLPNPELSSPQGEQVPPAKITYGGGMNTTAFGAPSADSSGTYHPPVPRPKAGSFNFAPGPCRPAQSNSGGWLDE